MEARKKRANAARRIRDRANQRARIKANIDYFYWILEKQPDDLGPWQKEKAGT